MITVHIRKQGGAAVITIPSNVLKMLDLGMGSTLILEVSDRGFTVKPLSTSKKRYTLTELLEGITPKDIKAMKEETEWFRDGDSVGREIL